ncbi:MAG: Levanase, partial [Planctomycetota bacterium]
MRNHANTAAAWRRCRERLGPAVTWLAIFVWFRSGPAAGAEPYRGEPYRPGFHFSPAVNWTNEPHGLVYADGLYHLFFQWNPAEPVFGNQHWGHAVSPDLLRWEQRPAALAPLPLPGSPAFGFTPTAAIYPFSGSAVIDVGNTSGLGAGSHDPLVLIHTGFDSTTGTQDQRLAVSNDGGMTFRPFAGNPVLEDPVNPLEARDPRVFWHEPDSAWKMVLAHGGQNRLSIWESPDLKSWSFRSNFTDPALESLGVTGWEMPDLVKLPVDGDSATTRWVMLWTSAQGGPEGKNGAAYATGMFNGDAFIRSESGTPLWADYGGDFDG